MNIKTRLAPSPTGYLHIGSLRTALYNYFFAKKNHGTFLLRIEDTDRTRYVEGSVEALLKTLKQMHLSWDEGPYVQSERLPIYQEHAQMLLEKGSAYYCFCTPERLKELRERQQQVKQSTKYDRHCLSLSTDEIQKRLAAGESHVIRLKIPDGITTFEDAIRGSITINNEEIDDQVLMKSDGFPTYHLAVVVDDHLMGITHIIRAEEWISSVPKHVHLYQSFGWDLPVFAHLPLVLNPDKSKLSKRQGDVAVEDYLAKGYLPEALINYVALLGFNPTADREIYKMDELIELFDLSKVNKSGAVFDVQKLRWMNGQYLRAMDLDALVSASKNFLTNDEVVTDEMLKKILTVEVERLEVLSEVSDRVRPYLSISDYDASILVWKKSTREDVQAQLQGLSGLVGSFSPSVFENVSLIEHAIKQYIESKSLQNGNVLWPLRVALSGSEQSASPFQLAWVLGKDETLSRLTIALNKLSA